jgi:tetratricopeptide (TPR) repeat protein
MYNETTDMYALQNKYRRNVWLSLLLVSTVLCSVGLLSPFPVFGNDDNAVLEKAGALLSQGRYHDAARKYRVVIKSHPDNPYAYLGLGLSLKGEGHLKEAQSVMEKLIGLAPQFPPAHYNLGLILEAQGDVASARQAFQEFINASGGQVPPDPEIRIKLRKMGLL